MRVMVIVKANRLSARRSPEQQAGSVLWAMSTKPWAWVAVRLELRPFATALVADQS
jgi:hypothetical protein